MPAQARSDDAKARERFVVACGKYKLQQKAYNKGHNDRKTSSSTTREIHKKMKAVIEKYGVSETRLLAEKINETLPREVRDIVYRYIWDTKTAKEALYSVRSPVLFDTPWLGRCPHSVCQCYRVDELPFFVQHQIVGTPMAREVAAAYYAAIPPDRLGYNIARLEEFLLRDHFHLGVVPADHIRHLRITISPLECKELGTITYNGNVTMSSAGHDIVDTTFQALDHIQHKVGFRLTVVLGTGIWGAYTEQTMECLSVAYEKLTKEGVRFRVYGRPSKAHFPILRVDRYFTMYREKYYDFVTEQLAAKGQFENEHSDDEDESNRSFLFDVAAPMIKSEVD